MALFDIRSQAIKRSPAELVEHLRSFKLNLKFSAGIWYFSPPASRFHEKYSPDIDIPARLEIAAKLKECGLQGLEAHYPNEINEQNLELWKQFQRDTGIKVVTVVPLLFWSKDYEFGSLSNPLEFQRRKAIDLTIRTLEVNRELDTEHAVIWPGIDGYENPFGIDLAAMRHRFVTGLAEAMDAVPGTRVAIEPKPYEPRGHIIFGTTPEGILLCHQVESVLRHPINRETLSKGHALCCLNPEVGHVLMAYEDLPYAMSWPLSEGRLAHLHLNSQPLGNYDQDLNVGTVSVEQLDAFMYMLKMHGYQGWFGIDINPERMDVAMALKISMDALRSACDRIDEIDHESIVFAVSNPDTTRGWIESYLNRQRTRHPEKLGPMPPLKKL